MANSFSFLDFIFILFYTRYIFNITPPTNIVYDCYFWSKNSLAIRVNSSVSIIRRGGITEDIEGGGRKVVLGLERFYTRNHKKEEVHTQSAPLPLFILYFLWFS